MKIRTTIEEVTPAKAAKWLTRNYNNRNIVPGNVDYIRRQIEAGDWMLNGETIKFDVLGNLLDGQHRLTAIVQSGITVHVSVTRGLETRSRSTVDRGSKRSVAQIIQMEHGEKHATLSVAVARALRLFDHGILTSVSAQETMKELDARRSSIDWMQRTISKTLPRSAYFFAPLVWLYNDYGSEIEQFAESMSTLEGLRRGSPIIALQRALMRPSADDPDRRSLTISMLTFSALAGYVEGDDVTARNLFFTSKGFDYFNTKLKEIPRRRPPGTCTGIKNRRCTFESVTRGDDELCWLHNKIKSSAGKKS